MVEALRTLLFAQSIGQPLPRWQIPHLLWMLMNVEFVGDQPVFPLRKG